jgi:hypothetical protein
MGEYADEIVDSMIDGWSGRAFRRHPFIPQPAPKPKNSQVFAKFARDGVNFKTGDVLFHMPSGTSGKMLGSRGDKILFKPDSRQKNGAI